MTAQERPQPDLFSLNGQLICSIVKRHHDELLYLFLVWVAKSQGAYRFGLEVSTRWFKVSTVLQSTVTFRISLRCFLGGSKLCRVRYLEKEARPPLLLAHCP